MQHLNEFFENKIVLCAVLSWAIAQIMKIIIDAYRTKSLSLDLIVSSGGFPSSHTSFVIATATAIGLQEGFNSAVFALSAVLSCVVMYDAMGVRRAAGHHAKILNELVLKIDNNSSVEEKLKELLGHTPLQVLGGLVLGIAVSTVMYM